MKTIAPGDLVVLDDFVAHKPLRVDTVYAKAAHRDNMFKAAIYRPDAKMLCHFSLAPIILKAADIVWREAKVILECKDCLRPLEAQQKIIDSDIVRAHPQWLEEPRLFSPPGKGGHPRGMAVDVALVTENGDPVDMGTPFDFMPEDRANNPSARSYQGFSEEIQRNRLLLEMCMTEAAKEAGSEILPLPQEWWDFRFMPEYYNAYAPISDVDLPPDMRMTYV